MFGYIVRRILQLIPVLIGISLITFILSFVIPGDPVRAIMGQRSDREAELRIRRKLGLDKPLVVQYLIFRSSSFMRARRRVRRIMTSSSRMTRFSQRTKPFTKSVPRSKGCNPI